jgi:hypothetical protein
MPASCKHLHCGNGSAASPRCDGPGSENFRITICTRAAVDALVERDGIVIGRHLLIVGNLNTARIEALLHDRLRRLDADTWQQLAEKIGRLAYWEFVDDPAAAG